MSEKENIESILSKGALFSKARKEVLSELAQNSHLVTKKKNENLFCQDEQATHCYYLVDGHVKLSRNTTDGDETVIDILTKDSLIGETSFFNEGLYSYSADAVSDTQLIVLPLTPMRELVKKEPTFCCQMLSHLGKQALEKDKELERRTLQETSHRIGCFLLSMCDDISSASITLELPYEKVLIAKKLGMRPETLSRGLQKLQKDIGLSIDGMEVTVRNIEELSQYSCAACSYSLTCKKSALTECI